MEPRSTLAKAVRGIVAAVFAAALLLGAAAVSCRRAAAAGSLDSAPEQQYDAADAAVAASILARYKAATGGAAWDSVRTVHTRFDLSVGSIRFASDEWDDAVGGRMALVSKLDDARRLEVFDGKRDWEQDDAEPPLYNDGPEEQREAVSDAYQRTNSYWYPGRMPGKITFLGKSEYKNALYDVIEVDPAGGAPVQMWFDHATGLLGLEIEQQAMDVQTTLYGKYCPVSVGDKPGESVLMPFEIGFNIGDSEPQANLKVKSASVNYAPPAGIFEQVPQLKPDYSFRNNAASTTVLFQLDDQQIRVPIKIDGHQETALFDTGTSLVITRYAADELRIDVADGGSASGNGEHAAGAGTAQVDDMEIGAIKIKQPKFKVIDSYTSADAPAIVGLPLLQRFVVAIDYDTGLMTLTRPDAFHYTGSGVVVPFTFHDGHIPIVSGSVDGIPGTFTIDTGDYSALTLNRQFNIDNDLKNRYQPKFAAITGYGVGGTEAAYVTRAKTLSLGAATVRSPVTFLRGGRSGAGADMFVSGVVGEQVLRQFNIIFDYPDERIILEPSKYYGQFDPYLRSGIVFNIYKGAVVGDVIPGSPAAEAGIQVGDEILDIDGVKPDGTKAWRDKFYAFNYGPIGTRTVVEFKRPKGKPQSATLVLRDIV